MVLSGSLGVLMGREEYKRRSGRRERRMRREAKGSYLGSGALTVLQDSSGQLSLGQQFSTSVI